MVVLFWIGGVALLFTAVPAAVFLGLHLATGEQVPLERAHIFWRWVKVIALSTFDLAIFTRVVQGLIAVW